MSPLNPVPEFHNVAIDEIFPQNAIVNVSALPNYVREQHSAKYYVEGYRNQTFCSLIRRKQGSVILIIPQRTASKIPAKLHGKDAKKVEIGIVCDDFHFDPVGLVIQKHSILYEFKTLHCLTLRKR